MCHICNVASTKSRNEGVFHTGPGNTTYSNVFEPVFDTLESHEDFIASLTMPNKLALFSGFKNCMIFNDPLHVIYRGFLPEFLGSVLLDLAMSHYFAPSKTIQINLDVAYQRCAAFLQRHGLGSLSLDDFTKEGLDDEYGFASLPGKATDAKLVCHWLASETPLVAQNGAADSRVIDLRFSCS